MAMDDSYFKRKGFDDFLKSAQNVGSFDDLAEKVEAYPKVIKADELMGHMGLEAAGAKEDDPRLLGKLRDMMYKDTDVTPAEIKIQTRVGDQPVEKGNLAHFDPADKTIVIKADANPIQKAATYMHESGHDIDHAQGKGWTAVNEFPEEKIAMFVKNNPNATDMDLKKFMESIKNYGMDSEAVAKLAPGKVKELQVTMHHEGAPRGFEMEKVYDILKGAGKNIKKIGKGITKVGVKSLPIVGAVAGLASGDASAAIPGMWSEDVGEGSDNTPQMSQEEMGKFRSLKERLEHEE